MIASHHFVVKSLGMQRKIWKEKPLSSLNGTMCRQIVLFAGELFFETGLSSCHNHFLLYSHAHLFISFLG